MKFWNCTEIIPTSNTTELKTEMFDECLDFFRNCTKTEENQFNDWKVLFKALSMSAGELNYNDLSFDDSPIYVLTYAFFIVLVLFVIMNLMTSLAVNDIHDIRNQSRDGAWLRLMFTLIWYDEGFPIVKAMIVKFNEFVVKFNEEKDANMISFKLNDVPFSLSNPSTWLNIFMEMPHSVTAKAEGIVPKSGLSKDTFSIVHNMDDFEEIVIIFGTSKKFYEVILKKGQCHEEPVNYWKTKFGIVDHQDGYDKRRKMYRAQCFTILGSTKLEINFKPCKGTTYGEFEVFEEDKKLEGTIKQYVDADPEKKVLAAIEKYTKAGVQT